MRANGKLTASILAIFAIVLSLNMLGMAAAASVVDTTAPEFTPTAYLDKNHNGIFDTPPDLAFTSVQAAIDAAVRGDTVMIPAGTIFEQLHVLNKTNINIVGSAGGTTITAIDPMAYSFSFESVDYFAMLYIDGCGGINVTNINFDGGTFLNPQPLLEPLGTANAAIAYVSSSGNVSQCTIHGITDTANIMGGYVGVIAANVDGDPETVNVTSCSFYNNMLTDVRVNGAGMSSIISGNTFLGLGGSAVGPQIGIWADGGVDVQVTGNDVSAYLFNDPLAQLDSYGIFLNQVAATSSVTSNNIHQNDWGLYMLDCPQGMPSALVVPISVSLNQFASNLYGAVLEEDTANLTSNTLVMNTVGASIVTMSGGVSNVTFYRNEITSNTGSGIDFQNILSGPRFGVVTVSGRMNNFTVNGFAVSNPDPINVDFIGNWWNDNSGPTVASNPSGIGDAITANVLYRPYITLGGPAITATPGSSSVTLDWTPASANFGVPILGYRVYYGTVTPNIYYGPDLSPTANTITITPLTPGTTYVFKVVAFNWYGNGNDSNIASAIPYTNPQPPTLVSAVPASTTVTLTWTAPSNTGYTSLTGYKVYYDTVSPPATQFLGLFSASTFSVTVTGLTNGQLYYFAVVAVNPAGDSGQSNVLSATPATVPDAPTGLLAVPSDGQVALSWTAPAWNGGAPIDHYVVYRDGIDVGHPTLTSITINGLTNGVTYTFTVAAHNVMGVGAQSAPAVATPARVPDAPTSLTATPFNLQVGLSWSAPPSNGGAAIDYYIVYQDGVDVAHPTTTSAMITGLTNGVLYTFTVSAHNVMGEGPQSLPATATPITVPGAPTALVATAGDSQVSLTWMPPASTGGTPIDYYVIYRDGIDVAHSAIASATVIGLTNGVTYSFTVAAHNLAGVGPQSSPALATPARVPDAPTALSATPFDSAVTLSWTAPFSDGGSAIDYYIVYQGGVDVAHPTVTTATITGLTNGVLYSFTVAAHNIMGIGPQSSPATATPAAVPGAPTGLIATPGDSSVSLSWTAPASTGGAVIDYYIVYIDGVDSAHPIITSAIMTGLTNGVLYTFAVAAHNAMGIGPESTPATATPATAPGAPTGLTASAFDASVGLSWTAPASNGGAAIDYYIVYQDGMDILHPTVTSATITGLTNGVLYTFTVAAHNIMGIGPQSSPATATPAAVPGAPTALTASPGNMQVGLTWTAPVNTGGSVINYYIVYQDGVDVAHPASTSATIIGLTNGVLYTFTVAAHNSVGIGPQSDPASATPATVPDAPTALTATPGNTEVSLSWAVPANGGAAIDYYVVSVDGVSTAYPTTNSVTIMGLTNGVSYAFTVLAHNVMGFGPSSAIVYATPMDVPSAPTGLTAIAGNAQATLSWDPPVNIGGGVIDYYVVYQDGIDIAHPSVTTLTVLSLTNGVTYSFTVAAHNAMGLGPQCLPVTVTPATVPGAPTGLMAAPGNTVAYLSWSAPASNGGAAIDYYVVYQDGIDIAHPTGTSMTATALTNGLLYTYTVAAHNVMGLGPQSASATVTPAAVPTAPLGLSAVPGNAQVVLTWSPPASSGGAIIDYYIVYQGGVDVGHPTVLTMTVIGLTNGVTYSFTVAAHNSQGLGPQSAPASATPATVPGAPTGLIAAPGNTVAYLSWSAPASNGGAAIDYYIVYQGGVDVAHPTGTSVTITGLTNGLLYSYTVAAHNVMGIGPISATATVTPVAVPGAPTGLAATPGNAQVSLSWVAPASTGGSLIDYYIVYQDGVALATLYTGLSATITGLTNGLSYTFTVAAHNAAGLGPQSLPVSAIPATVPGAPTALTALPYDSSVGLSWTAPASNGGAAIDHYVVYQDGVDVAHPTGTSMTVTGLTNGVLYSFAVAAHNVMGLGPLSTPASAIPLAVPSAPLGLAATPGNAQVVLTWLPPASVGGSAIDHYIVYQDGLLLPTQYAGLTATITGLTNGVSYTFTVSAHNSAGYGPQSLPASATPATVPGAPTILSAEPENTAVILTWSAPLSNGGAAIDHYVVYQDGVAVAYPTGLTATITGLTNSVTYTFTVAAHNAMGIGGLSAPVMATPVAVPDAPTGLVAVPGDSQVILSWIAPLNIGGSSIDYYIVFQDGVALPTHYAGLTATITGLTNGVSYTFTVAAHNYDGLSLQSLPASATPATVPGAPTGLSALAESHQVSLSWTAPASNGGAAIDFYVVYIDGVPSAYPTTTSMVVTGLTNGVTYTFTVSAHNAMGIGPQSSPAMATPAEPPTVPLNLVAYPADSSVLLSWDAPASTGGAPIDYYIVYMNGIDIRHVGTTTAIITGLTNGVMYTFQVSAHNVMGESPLSDPAYMRPARAPDAPTGLTAVPADSQVALSWTAPAFNGGAPILRYVIYQDGVAVADTAARSITITGLVNGVNYTFTVAAVNAMGTGAASSPAWAIPATVPGAPYGLVAEPGNGRVNLNWTAPADNGRAIDFYIVYQDGVDVAHPTTLSATITDLTNGVTYTFEVSAHNAMGEGSRSAAVDATPADVPGVPTNLAAVPGNAQVSLTWNAPASDGGAAIDHYVVYQDGVDVAHVSGTSVTITGLFNGVTYAFAVAAHNVIGTGTHTSEVSATPRTVPDAPVLVSAVAGSSQVELTWTAPSFNGGSPLTGYKVYYGTTSTPGTLFGTYSASTLSVTVTGLTPGTLYYFGVKAVNIAGDSAMSNVRSTTPYTTPNAPTLNTATAGSSQVTISWTAPGNTGYTALTGYKVYYGTTSTPGTLFGTYSASTLSVTVTGLTPGTLYYFGVKAVNIAGDSPMSNVLSARPYTVPGAPNLVSANAGSSLISLTWTAPLNDGGSVVTGYRVYYGTTTPDVLFGSYGAATLSADVTGLTPGTTYYFGVKAVNAAGDSALSNVRSAVPYTTPSAPQNLGGSAGNRSVQIYWEPPVMDGFTPILEYNVYRGDTPTTLSLVATVSDTSYIDTGLVNGNTYYYAVSAVNAAGEGPQSSVISLVPRGDPTAPILTSAVAGIRQVTLNWLPPAQMNGTTLLGFYVYYGTASGNYIRYGGMLAPEARSINVTGLIAETRYFFAVSALTSTVETDKSNEMSAVPYTTPNAPVLVTAVAGISNVSLSWNAPVDNGGSPLTQYKVYYGTSATPSNLFATVGADHLSVVVTGLTAGVQYYFGVKAVNIAGDSPLSNVMSAIPLGAPTAPTLVNATAGMGTVTLTWQPPSSNGSSPITGYQVYYGIGTPDTLFGGAFSPETRQVTVTGLTAGTTYSFGVRALNNIGSSPLSNVMTATPYSLPSAPTLTGAVPGANWVILTWTAPGSNGSGPLLGYYVYYGLASPPTTQFGTMLSPGTMSINVTGLTTGALYYFGVKAVNAFGNGPLSNVLNATTVSVPPAPTGLTYTATSAQVSLSWNAVSGATSYSIYRGATQAALVLIGNSTSAAFSDTAVSSGAIYYYKVSARNSYGEGLKSEALQVNVPAPTKVAVTGIITDANGNPLSGITVKLEDGTTTTTNASGGFSLMAMPGNHTLTISGPGIETKDMPVTVSSTGTNVGSISTKAATDWTWLIILVVIVIIGLIIVVFLLRGRGKKPVQSPPEKK